MRHLHSLALTAALLAIVGAGPGSNAQQIEIIDNNLKYSTGQAVQPVFEGWSRNPDGSFNMHFGYLNRNYVQKVHVPVGRDNGFEPGPADRGQPTFFYTRTNRNLFSVSVPRDWGKKELIWTVTANGKTEKAYGWLQAEWEIDPAGGAGQGGRTDAEYQKNKPPTIKLETVAPLTLPAVATLSADVTDDGLPKPRSRRKPPVGQETPPTLVGGPDAPVNVPELGGAPSRGDFPPRQEGITVRWIVWRGPAEVTFEPASAPVKGGKAVTKGTFTAAGEYVLRARANDSMLSTLRDLTVSVKGS